LRPLALSAPAALQAPQPRLATGRSRSPRRPRGLQTRVRARAAQRFRRGREQPLRQRRRQQHEHFACLQAPPRLAPPRLLSRCAPRAWRALCSW
jgi:hypothetical protein